MKIRATRDIIYGAENVMEGQTIDLPDGVAQMWIENGYGVEYEIKPYQVRPMSGDGKEKPQSSPPRVRRSRKRKSKPAGATDSS